ELEQAAWPVTVPWITVREQEIKSKEKDHAMLAYSFPVPRFPGSPERKDKTGVLGHRGTGALEFGIHSPRVRFLGENQESFLGDQEGFRGWNVCLWGVGFYGERSTPALPAGRRTPFSYRWWTLALAHAEEWLKVKIQVTDDGAGKVAKRQQQEQGESRVAGPRRQASTQARRVGSVLRTVSSAKEDFAMLVWREWGLKKLSMKPGERDAAGKTAADYRAKFKQALLAQPELIDEMLAQPEEYGEVWVELAGEVRAEEELRIARESAPAGNELELGTDLVFNFVGTRHAASVQQGMSIVHDFPESEEEKNSRREEHALPVWPVKTATQPQQGQTGSSSGINRDRHQLPLQKIVPVTIYLFGHRHEARVSMIQGDYSISTGVAPPAAQLNHNRVENVRRSTVLFGRRTSVQNPQFNRRNASRDSCACSNEKGVATQKLVSSILYLASSRLQMPEALLPDTRYQIPDANKNIPLAAGRLDTRELTHAGLNTVRRKTYPIPGIFCVQAPSSFFSSPVPRFPGSPGRKEKTGALGTRGTGELEADSAMLGQKVVIVVGVSGSGKSEMLRQLMNDYPDRFVRPEVWTTRAARQGVVETEDKTVVSVGKFTAAAEQGLLSLVRQSHGGDWYGVFNGEKEIRFAKDQVVILDTTSVRTYESMKRENPRAGTVLLTPVWLSAGEGFLSAHEEDFRRILHLRMDRRTNMPFEKRQLRLEEAVGEMHRFMRMSFDGVVYTGPERAISENYCAFQQEILSIAAGLTAEGDSAMLVEISQRDLQRINEIDLPVFYYHFGLAVRHFVASHRGVLLDKGLHIVTCLGNVLQASRWLTMLKRPHGAYFWINFGRGLDAPAFSVDGRSHPSYHVWIETDDGFILDAYPLDGGVPFIQDINKHGRGLYQGRPIAELPGVERDRDRWNEVAAALEGAQPVHPLNRFIAQVTTMDFAMLSGWPEHSDDRISAMMSESEVQPDILKKKALGLIDVDFRDEWCFCLEQAASHLLREHWQYTFVRLGIWPEIEVRDGVAHLFWPLREILERALKDIFEHEIHYLPETSKEGAVIYVLSEKGWVALRRSWDTGRWYPEVTRLDDQEIGEQLDALRHKIARRHEERIEMISMDDVVGTLMMDVVDFLPEGLQQITGMPSKVVSSWLVKGENGLLRSPDGQKAIRLRTLLPNLRYLFARRKEWGLAFYYYRIGEEFGIVIRASVQNEMNDLYLYRKSIADEPAKSSRFPDWKKVIPAGLETWRHIEPVVESEKGHKGADVLYPVSSEEELAGIVDPNEVAGGDVAMLSFESSPVPQFPRTPVKHLASSIWHLGCRGRDARYQTCLPVGKVPDAQTLSGALGHWGTGAPATDSAMLSVDAYIEKALARDSRFLKTTRPMRTHLVIPMFDEGRLWPTDEHSDGENAFAIKIGLLEGMRKQNPHFDWRALFVDDGTPGNRSFFDVEELWKRFRYDYYRLHEIELSQDKVEVMWLSPKEKAAVASYKGGAAVAGLLYALEQGWGNIIAFTDVDISIDLRMLKLLLPYLMFNEADVVIPSRRAKGSYVIGVPFEGKASSIGFNLYVRWLFKRLRHVGDTQRALKLFRPEVLRDILPHMIDFDFTFDVQMLDLAVLFGYRIKEQGIYWEDSPKASKLSMSRERVKQFRRNLQAVQQYDNALARQMRDGA
ncbi:MAG TPA: hypothetical protein VLL97_04185, partial [Acidobacteriota bacterium]|nr:hypothetical protein [Acidobacteriota bacterium]